MKDVYTLSPINKTAAIVTSKGFSYTSSKKPGNPWDSKNPIPIDSTKKSDLLGLRAGRLLVLGYAENGNGRLVVRCDCGVYTMRKEKALKNPKNKKDRCEECRHLAYLKRDDIRRRTGREVEWDEY
jgi:hypothetical protein